jgi:hypothetical protein
MKNSWYLLLIVALVLISTGLAQTQQGHVLLRDAGLYKTPATYTELSFTDPATIPNSLARPNGVITVSFGIHNVANDVHAYQWSILFVRGSESEVKSSGTAVTPPGGRSAITSRVTASCTGGRLQVVVRLASPAESINFWLTCPQAPVANRTAR